MGPRRDADTEDPADVQAFLPLQLGDGLTIDDYDFIRMAPEFEAEALHYKTQSEKRQTFIRFMRKWMVEDWWLPLDDSTRMHVVMIASLCSVHGRVPCRNEWVKARANNSLGINFARLLELPVFEGEMWHNDASKFKTRERDMEFDEFWKSHWLPHGPSGNKVKSREKYNRLSNPQVKLLLDWNRKEVEHRAHAPTKEFVPGWPLLTTVINQKRYEDEVGAYERDTTRDIDWDTD